MGNPNTTAKTGRFNLALQKRKEKIIKLRLTGLTESQIAEKVGVTQPIVHKHLKIELERTVASIKDCADELRAIELLRLEEMTLMLAPKIAKGDIKAIDTALRISARRCQLLGLDMGKQDRSEFNAVIEGEFSEEGLNALPPPAQTLAEWVEAFAVKNAPNDR